MPEAEWPHLSFSPLGDRALLIDWAGDAAENDAALRLAAMAIRIGAAGLPGITDIVPAFRSIALHYDPVALAGAGEGRAPYDALIEHLQILLSDVERPAPLKGRLFEVPVVYGGENGEDLASLASACGLTEAQAIEIHCAPAYSVLMLGFAPGFGYLGPVDERLRQPRKPTPRTSVPSGSVALANDYTGIYPLVLPGGWHVIGRTPWRLFDPDRTPPALLAAGDNVRFVPVPAARFTELEKDQSWR
jgi:KipI family sensor histidine kinase inhibitor